MGDRTAAAAIRRLLDTLQHSLSSVARSNSLYTDSYQLGVDHPVMATGGAQRIHIELRGTRRLSLEMVFNFRVNPDPGGGWRTTTRKYIYTLVDVADRELFLFHWHPEVPGMTGPHLHIGPGVGELYPALSRLHVPTGRVALEDVLRFTVRDLGIEPLREDWQDLLDAERDAFVGARTWA